MAVLYIRIVPSLLFFNLCSANPIFKTFVAHGGKNTPRHISTSRWDRNIIPTAIHPFSMTAIPMELSVKLSDVTRSEKSKMAASELPKCISQLVQKIATKFQRLYQCFWGPTIKYGQWQFVWPAICMTKWEETGSGKSKIAVSVSKLPNVYLSLYTS